MNSKERMLEMFIFETFEMIEQLQQLIIDSEKINDDKEADGDFTLFTEKANDFLDMLKESNKISENCEKCPNDITKKQRVTNHKNII